MDTRFTFDCGETSSHSIEMLYFIRKSQRLISNLKPAFRIGINGFEKALFGGICSERLLIGHEKGVYEYKMKENRWICVHNQCFNNDEKEYDEHCTKFCVNKEAVVICGGQTNNNAVLKIKIH